MRTRIPGKLFSPTRRESRPYLQSLRRIALPGMETSDLTDDQRERFRPLLPPQKDRIRRPATTTALSSTALSGSCVRAAACAACRIGMAPGRRSPVASIDGRRPASGSGPRRRFTAGRCGRPARLDAARHRQHRRPCPSARGWRERGTRNRRRWTIAVAGSARRSICSASGAESRWSSS